MKQNIRKGLLLIASLAVVSGVLWGTLFYWQNLRGVGPAIKPPPGDIAVIIDALPKDEQGEPLPPGKNNTDFPLALPDGFSISVFAKDIGSARVLAQDSAGNILVSITKEGKVLALPDRDNNGVADEVVTVIENLNRPHGLAFLNGKIYIAETDQVRVYDYDEERQLAQNGKNIMDLPGGGNHFTRTIMFTPDDRLLVSVGSTCNVCDEGDWRRAKILVSNADGSDVKVFASGLRNAVFMAVHPFTKQLWVTEMGRDLIGDDIPPDEINIVEEEGNYGWPLCYGKNVLDTDFHKDDHVHIRPDCTEPFEIPSHINLQAHSAPLGLAFVSGQGWPTEYANDLLVSYHGSWNRTVPTGYKIMRFRLDEQGNYLDTDSTGSPQGEDFISGWLQGGSALGRPVDILAQSDGTMFISDDKASVVYRLKYAGAQN